MPSTNVFIDSLSLPDKKYGLRFQYWDKDEQKWSVLTNLFDFFVKGLYSYSTSELCSYLSAAVRTNPEVLKDCDAEGNTLFHKVVQYWDEDKEKWNTLIDFFDDLVDNKADLNAQNDRGETPIMIAIKKDKYF